MLYILDSGETDATGRLPYLDHGILDILTNATGGIGLVLEHRFYGESFPQRSQISPTSDVWDTDGLRYLNTTQALEDSANFVRNIKVSNVPEPAPALLAWSPLLLTRAKPPSPHARRGRPAAGD